jgi:uncharacterized membrane protein
MDWYAIFKFLHVVAAVCWVGGGAVLMYAGLLAGRARDDDRQMSIIKVTASLAMVWFIPASLGTVILGAITATLGNSWADAWVIIGLVGFAATFVTGNFFIRPTADAIAAAEAAGKRDVAMVNGKRLLQIAKFDYVMLFAVIADMVLKPQWSDTVLLGIIAVVLIVGAVVYLLPGLRMPVATA